MLVVIYRYIFKLSVFYQYYLQITYQMLLSLLICNKNFKEDIRNLSINKSIPK